eukprot:217201_1
MAFPFTASQSDLLRSFSDSGYFITPANYLEDQLAFYGTYHSVFGNKLIHFIFVPLLLISGTAAVLLFLSSYINVYLICIGWSVMYPLTYVYIDITSGLSWFPVATLSWFASQYVAQTYSFQAIMMFFIISFGIQFTSHYLIEKRQPAMMDSLYQSLVLAPLFVWFELVIFPLGYYSETREKVKSKINKMHRKMDKIK